MQWSERYRPSCFAEVMGQNLAVEKVKKFIKDFQKNLHDAKKAIIFYGPPGTGKTTIAHVIANETNSEIFELNASDLRNKEKLHEILRPAIEQKSLLGRGKIILIDEVDGISSVDRGGLEELLLLIDSSSYPVIITANDIWGRKLNSLRKKSEIVQLKEIDYRIIRDLLIEILRRENCFIKGNILTNISVKAKGDLRAAINDLQTVAGMRGYSDILIDERNKETDIFSALRMIFKGKPHNDTLKIFDSVQMPIDEIILWLEENIPLEYGGEDLAKACELLSKADIFKERIYKQQYWRFLVYENIFLSYGISASKNSNKNYAGGFTNYKKPMRILKMWMNNQRISTKKSITQKYAKYVHIGEKRALKEFPLLKQILLNSVVQKELKLSEEEILYLKEPAGY